MSKQHELKEQQTLFEFLALIESQEPMLKYMFHVPNGGHRHPVVAAKMKMAGVKRGVPDILFPIPFGQYAGLAIELKAGLNRTTNEQDEWLNVLANAKWQTHICYGWVDAAICIVKYIGKNPESYHLHIAKAVTPQKKKRTKKTPTTQ